MLFQTSTKGYIRYSRQLLEAIVKLAGDKHLYATTRENNEPMRHTNCHCGFEQSGHIYKSEAGNYNLILYTIGHKLRVGLDVKASIASKMAEPSGLRLRLTRPKGLAWAT